MSDIAAYYLAMTAACIIIGLCALLGRLSKDRNAEYEFQRLKIGEALAWGFVLLLPGVQVAPVAHWTWEFITRRFAWILDALDRPIIRGGK